MPFIASWPGKIKPGVTDALVSQVDLMASFAALTGQEFDHSKAPDTQNQLPALLGESKKGRKSLVEDASGLAFREGDWKYIPPGRTRDKLGPWTKVRIPEPGFLFNLATDPGETNNLAWSQPEKLKDLSASLAKILADAMVEE